jgi:uncharacterized protein (TIGR02996 family)
MAERIVAPPAAGYDTGMSDEDALLAAIIAAPDDDLPRLVYADWLDERGQPDRAEFIRMQIERERLEPAGPRYAVLARKEAALIGRHKEGWTTLLRTVLPGSTAKFRRGFVEEVSTPAAVLLANAEAVWPLAPIRRVVATRGAPVVPELNALARPPKVRLTAELIGGGHGGEFGRLDLLRPSPAEPEPWLRQGRWLVLCWPWEGSSGRRAVTRFADAVRRRGWVGWGSGSYNFAARPLREEDDPRAWCPRRLPTDESSWLLFQDGELISHQTCRGRVGDLGEEFWEPVGGIPVFLR